MLDKLTYLVGSIVLSSIFTIVTMFSIAYVIDLIDKKSKNARNWIDDFFD